MGKSILPGFHSERKEVSYDFYCYRLRNCRIAILCCRLNRRMGNMERYPRLAFSCWHLFLHHRRNSVHHLASGELCLTAPPHGRDTPFFCQWVALLFGRLIGDAMSRIFNFCAQTVKNFTSNLHKHPPRNLLKFVQFASCFFLCYLVYSYQEVRVRPTANKRKELIQWQSTNGGIIF